MTNFVSYDNPSNLAYENINIFNIFERFNRSLERKPENMLNSHIMHIGIPPFITVIEPGNYGQSHEGSGEI